MSLSVLGGAVKNVVDYVYKLKETVTSLDFADGDENTRKKYVKNLLQSSRSINASARQNILHFPILYSDSCDYEMLQELATAIETRNAVLIKIVLETGGIIDMKIGETKGHLIDKIRGRNFSVNENCMSDEEIAAVPGLKEIAEGHLPFDDVYYLDEGISDRGLTKEQIQKIEGKVEEKVRLEDLEIRKSIALNRRQLGKSSATIEKKTIKSEPTIITVEVQYRCGDIIGDTSLIIGVKSLLHRIGSEEFIKFLPKAKFDTSFLLKLARLKTGEISFIKDFLFNISESKKTFLKSKSGSHSWYAKLKRISDVNDFNRMSGKKVIFATVTIVLSMEDVEEMKNRTNGKFDLTQSSEAGRLVESLTLLNLVIIDSALERVWFYDDSISGYEIRPLDYYKKEEKGISKSDLLKTIVSISK